MHKIKRYANRKLYDTTDKKYITLEGISQLVKAGEKISVTDNKTGEDLTSGIISQILAKDGQVKGNDLASRVLIQMLRKGPGTLVDYGKRYVSLWDRALTMADEEIDKLVDRLVKEKEISESEGSALKKDMTGRAEDLKKWVGEKIDQRVDEILDAMNLVTKDQVNGLTEEIRKLTRKIEKLERQQAKKTSVSGKALPVKKGHTETLPVPKDGKPGAVELVSGSPASERGLVDASEEKEMAVGGER